VVFSATKLDELASLRGATVHYLVGRRGSREMRPIHSTRGSRRLVPDVFDRDIYVCGPAGMMERVLPDSTGFGSAESQIHYERFNF